MSGRVTEEGLNSERGKNDRAATGSNGQERVGTQCGLSQEKQQPFPYFQPAPPPSTHNLVTLGDIGQTLDSHLRYRMEAGVTDLDVP